MSWKETWETKYFIRKTRGYKITKKLFLVIGFERRKEDDG